MSVPDGDVLVHAGDFSLRGTPAEIADFDGWLGRLPHTHKLVVAGNHDWLFEREPERARALLRNATYLQDSGVTLGGLRFWGSPWQPRFFDWAFNLDRGEALKARWDLIPDDLDVLVTHGPPYGILDLAGRERPAGAALGPCAREHVGCEELLRAVESRPPRLHVFGHIHEGYGSAERERTRFVNASSCDRAYRPVQPPLVVTLS